MKRLASLDRIQAYLLRDLLAMHGIEAHVLNANMQGAVGELPVDVALPQVWIADEAQLERARAVLREFEADLHKDGERACPACGERNPAAFEVCWNCGAPL